MGTLFRHSTQPAAGWLLAIAIIQMLRSGLAVSYPSQTRGDANGDIHHETVHFEQAYEEVFDHGEGVDPEVIQEFLDECSAHLFPVDCVAAGDPGGMLWILLEGSSYIETEAARDVLKTAGGMQLTNYVRLTLEREGKGDGMYLTRVVFEGDYQNLVAGEEELFLEECSGELIAQGSSSCECVAVFEGSILVELQSTEKSDLVVAVETMRAEGLYLPSFGNLTPISVTLTLPDTAYLTETSTEPGTADANETFLETDTAEPDLLEGIDSGGDTHVFLIVAAVSGAIGALLVMCVAAAIFYWCFQRRRSWSSEEHTLAEVAKSSNVTPSIVAPSSENPTPPSGYRAGRVGEVRDLVSASIITKRSPWEGIPEADRTAPSYWENQDLFSSKVCWVKVGPDEMESLQRLVDATFRSTATRDRVGGHMPSGLRIVLAHRIENPSLWKRYVIDRHAIDQKRMSRCTPLSLLQGDALTSTVDAALGGRLKHEVNEAYLWHGTRPASAIGISSSGFKLERAGSGGSLMGKGMYGSGMYFAENSSKSDEYAKDDDEGVHAGLFCLMLCRVALGEMMHMTAGGEHTHDMIATGLDAGIYDSVLGDRHASVGTYREFVVYEEALVYPEYVIVYERQFRSPSSEHPELPV